MDAAYFEPPRQESFKAPRWYALDDLVAVFEAGAGFIEPLAVEITIGNYHRTHEFLETTYGVEPLALLVETPRASRYGAVKESWLSTVRWSRPALDAALFEEAVRFISGLESDDPDCDRHWVTASVSVLDIRLPEPETLAGRSRWLADNDRYWERLPIEWRAGEPWLAGVGDVRSPLRLELDGEFCGLDVVVDHTTWGASGAGRSDLAEFYRRLGERGFSAG